MKFADRFAHLFKSFLPTPFTIAILLSVFTFAIALVFTEVPSAEQNSILYIAQLWEEGFWKNGLLVFAVQMMLMLVLGHNLALTPFVDRMISKIVVHCDTTSKAAFTVALFTLIVAWLNWGLGLIFGAIFARKVAEFASKNNLKINYPLIGAAGYSGLMIWHGGISGSSLIKVAEENHISKMVNNNLPASILENIPSSIGFNETVFSPMNLVATVLCLLVIPLSLFWLGKRTKNSFVTIDIQKKYTETHLPHGAEKLDYSSYFGKLIGLLILFYCGYKLVQSGNSFFIPNNINLTLLGLTLLLHQNILQFLNAIDDAIRGASGILIQFPLYFGIMGIMNGSGLVQDLSGFFVSISNEYTYPIFTFFSAGIVNIFVPSGGGQWAVQGPIIINAASEMGVPLAKNILAMAYGDQLTNMLQPFWALPLLGITGLKAKEIIPYTVFIMLIGGLIFLGILLLF